MKRKELWELLGEVPADMIEEASIPRKGNRVLSVSYTHLTLPTN